jgi:hypothetical protein
MNVQGQGGRQGEREIEVERMELLLGRARV